MRRMKSLNRLLVNLMVDFAGHAKAKKIKGPIVERLFSDLDHPSV